MPPMRPDANKRNVSPEFARALFERAGLSLPELGKRIGIAERTLRCYKDDGPGHLPLPYPVQFAIESLIADRSEHDRATSTARRNGSEKARRPRGSRRAACG